MKIRHSMLQVSSATDNGYDGYVLSLVRNWCKEKIVIADVIVDVKLFVLINVSQIFESLI